MLKKGRARLVERAGAVPDNVVPMRASDCEQIIRQGMDRAVTKHIEGNFAYLRC